MTRIIKRFAGWFQLLFVVAVVGIAILTSITLKPEPSNRMYSRAPDPVVVSVVEPQATAFEPSVKLNGVVESRTITDVIPQVSGRVIEVSATFRSGAAFAKGDVLFRIDPSDYELAVERTLAEIEAARSDLALLEAQVVALEVLGLEAGIALEGAHHVDPLALRTTAASCQRDESAHTNELQQSCRNSIHD